MNVAEEQKMKTRTMTANILKSRIAIALLAATIVTVGMAVVPALVVAPGTSSVVENAYAELSIKQQKTNTQAAGTGLTGFLPQAFA